MIHGRILSSMVQNITLHQNCKQTYVRTQYSPNTSIYMYIGRYIPRGNNHHETIKTIIQ